MSHLARTPSLGLWYTERYLRIYNSCPNNPITFLGICSLVTTTGNLWVLSPSTLQKRRQSSLWAIKLWDFGKKGVMYDEIYPFGCRVYSATYVKCGEPINQPIAVKGLMHVTHNSDISLFSTENCILPESFKTCESKLVLNLTNWFQFPTNNFVWCPTFVAIIQWSKRMSI